MTWYAVAIGAFAGAVASRVVGEMFDWFPWLAERIVERAARLLPADVQDRYCAEWLAELEKLSKQVRGITSLIFAFRILFCAPAVAREVAGKTSLRRQFASYLLEVRTARRRLKRSSDTSSLLLVVTFCLLAFGAVMVYSASSATPSLHGDGDSYVAKFVLYSVVGLMVMQGLARGGMAIVHKVTAPLLVVSFVLVAAVHIPHIGVAVDGAWRWVGPASLRFEPSELMKLALVLYAAALLARRPERAQSLRKLARLLLVVGGACLLLVTQPNLGAAIVIVCTIAGMLVAAGTPPSRLALIGVSVLGLVLIFSLAEPYARARLISFIDPWSHASTSGYQAVQGQIAINAGGLFGVGPGHSTQNLPAATTSSILAVVGQDLGVMGMCVLLFLYGLIAYAGLRAAKTARSLYSALIAVGLTTLIISQALLNIFGVLGLAPLVGMSLPLVSYDSSNMMVMLAAMGLLRSVAAGPASHVRVVSPARRRRMMRVRRALG